MTEAKEGFNLDEALNAASAPPEGNEEVQVVAEEGAEAAAVDETEKDTKAEPEAVTEEEDDEKWHANGGGKPWSDAAVKSRIQRWKKQRDELEGKHKSTLAELEAARKSQPATAEDLERFKRLDGVFQNLDKSAREMPWVTEMLLALGEGKKPDWNKVKEGMEAYIASVPKGDPILYQQQQEIRAQVEELQTERMNSQAISHIQTEDIEIAKILGDKSDPVAAQLWAILNEQANAIFAATNPKSFKDAPNRVQMAKRMQAAMDAYTQKKMKAAVPPPTRAQPIKTGSGVSGGPPIAKTKPPVDIHSPEFAEYILGGGKPKP